MSRHSQTVTSFHTALNLPTVPSGIISPSLSSKYHEKLANFPAFNPRLSIPVKTVHGFLIDHVFNSVFQPLMPPVERLFPVERVLPDGRALVGHPMQLVPARRVHYMWKIQGKPGWGLSSGPWLTPGPPKANLGFSIIYPVFPKSLIGSFNLGSLQRLRPTSSLPTAATRLQTEL